MALNTRMGCNAWNHRSDCNCGWGGDTGGSGFHGSLPTSSAYWWQAANAPRYEAYVNPNASCPVCGEAVFFYQSPYGGRVFFDQLGPPWPKHPCTDNSAHRSGGMVVHPAPQGTLPRLPAGWSPLLLENHQIAASDDLVSIKMDNRLPGKVLFAPGWFRCHGPIFFKKDSSDPLKVVLSTWDNENNREETLSVDSWFQSQEHRQDYLLFGKPIPASALNALGWSWSFAHQRADDMLWHTSQNVDWDIARCFFVNAARAKSWTAANNLAVMKLRGFVPDKPPSFAVMMLFRAIRLSSKRDATPLRHLANCYRTGFGVSVDGARADELDLAAERLKVS